MSKLGDPFKHPFNGYKLSKTQKAIAKEKILLNERLESKQRRLEKVKVLNEKLEKENNKKPWIKTLNEWKKGRLQGQISIKNGRINLDERYIEFHQRNLDRLHENLEHYERIAIKKGKMKDNSDLLKTYKAQRTERERMKTQALEPSRKNRGIPKFEDLAVDKTLDRNREYIDWNTGESISYDIEPGYRHESNSNNRHENNRYQSMDSNPVFRPVLHTENYVQPNSLRNKYTSLVPEYHSLSGRSIDNTAQIIPTLSAR
jgi:hypothetical protein